MGDEFALPNPFVLLLVILIGVAASVGLAVSAVIRMVRFGRGRDGRAVLRCLAIAAASAA